MLDWHGTGLSVMEMSHRSPEFVSISESAKNDLRKFLEIPDNFKVFFFQGGATMQYAAIVKNLLKPGQKACYLTTGLWSEQCITEAKKMLEPIEVATGARSNFTKIDSPDQWNIDKDSSYFHYCQNETVHGFQFQDSGEAAFPHKLVEGMTVVCDMSSDIGSRKIEWDNFGVIYAGAQKNLGAAGVTVVIIREDLIGH